MVLYLQGFESSSPHKPDSNKFDSFETRFIKFRVSDSFTKPPPIKNDLARHYPHNRKYPIWICVDSTTIPRLQKQKINNDYPDLSNNHYRSLRFLYRFLLTKFTFLRDNLYFQRDNLVIVIRSRDYLPPKVYFSTLSKLTEDNPI